VYFRFNWGAAAGQKTESEQWPPFITLPGGVINFKLAKYYVAK
jgi:hypothetical protein